MPLAVLQADPALIFGRGSGGVGLCPPNGRKTSVALISFLQSEGRSRVAKESCPPHLNAVAEVPNAVDHTSPAGLFGSIHAVGPPAGSARSVPVVVDAVVGTTHQSFATTLGWRNAVFPKNLIYPLSSEIIFSGQICQ